MKKIEASQESPSELKELRARLREAEETLRAIRKGEVDALVMDDAEGEHVFILKDAFYPYRVFFDEMNEGALTLNLHGLILYCNNRFAEILPLPKESIIGEPFLRFVDGEEFVNTSKLLSPNLRKKKKGESVLRVEKRMIPVTISVTTVLLEGTERLFMLVSDVTDQKKNFQELQESEAKFKFVFDHSVIGKSITQFTGEIQVNQAFADMLGYSVPEMQHRTWQDITHPEDIELTQRSLDTLLSSDREVVRFSKRYVHKNGSPIRAEVNIFLHKDVGGNPKYYVVNAIEIPTLAK